MANRNPNHVAMKIKAMFEEAQPLFTNKCCIYKVPNEIRKLNTDAYTPKVVSVGAFHHGDKKLLNMECQKQIYCKMFIERSDTNLEALVAWVQRLENQVRCSYSHKLRLSEEEHVMVILVDCGFIIELFLRYHFKQWKEDDAISLSPWLRSDIRLDLLLLENQLPFFVLQKLYDVAFASNSAQHPSFIDLTLAYFKDNKVQQNFSHSAVAGNIKHFTDLLRSFFLQPYIINRTIERGTEVLTHLKSATELCESRVEFKADSFNGNLLDLRFSDGTLTMPEIKVDDTTEVLLRNVIALEQCHYSDKSYITDYVAVLKFLISTDKDVDLLVKSGIIVNWLGDSRAVAELFSCLWKNVTQTKFNSEYFDMCRRMNTYCENYWRKKYATLKRDYCNTTWKTIASWTAFFLVILTVIQTMEDDEDHNPNPNEVLIKINAMLEEAQHHLTDECCIHRVPDEIRKFKEDAYTPRVVSIGPFHHGDPKLLKMEGL
ncbi:hypothetical protein PIB30_073064 [Stylosanthes scabra]|uniref:Uncharacterized protein n=1 Tax=Stylosanthes scabra TaxID=79078 RepID=A0ABU6QP20_9FABA|nr:hypothetical protein [Stylosanthes scabra]